MMACWIRWWTLSFGTVGSTFGLASISAPRNWTVAPAGIGTASLRSEVTADEELHATATRRAMTTLGPRDRRAVKR